MDDKNLDKDFLTIKNFAKLAGITVKSLQHYDRKGIFSPAKRGVKFKNDYRYYSPLQITTVKMLRVLTEIGVPLNIIKELMQDRSPEKMVKLLSANRDRVASEIRFLQEVHSTINTVTELMNEGINAAETEMVVSEMPEKRVIKGNVTEYRDGEGFMREFLCFCHSSHETQVNTSFPIGGYFENMETFLHEPSRPTCFFSIDPKGRDVKPAGLYLIAYTRGYYGQTNDLPERMAAFAKKNGLSFNGPVYNIYLSAEISEVDPDQYLLQVSVAVAETRRVPSRRPRRFYKYK
jgi:DNA-binding transcriptional MerR regulator